MTLLTNNVIGFETGGLEEASIASSNATVQSTVVKHGTYALELLRQDGVPGFYEIEPFESVSDQGDDQIVGVWWRAASVGTTTNIIRAREDASSCWRLEQSSAALVLYNAAESQIASVGSVFVVDTWYLIEIRWQHLDSGAIDVHVDSVSKIAETAQDLSQGGTFDNYIMECSDPTNKRFYDVVYCRSGAAGTGDFFGDAEGMVYQKTTGGATEQGDALDDGTWALVSETPGNDGASNDAAYTAVAAKTGGVSTDGGTRSGPSGDAEIDGDSNIKFVKFLHRAKKTTGTTQYAVPIADVSQGSWTQGAGDGDADAFDELDEGIDSGTPDDLTTYWQSASGPTNDKIRCNITALTDPVSSATHILKARVRKSGGGGQIDVIVRLFEGTTQIASVTATDIGTSFVDVTHTLSTAEANSITNYADLRIEVDANQPSGPGRNCYCTGMEFECPPLIPTMYKRYGNSDDGMTDAVVTLSTAYQNFFTGSEAAGVMPLSTEFCQHGFRKTAGQEEFVCSEIWAFILHVPSAGPGADELSAARMMGIAMVPLAPPVALAY